MKWTLTVDRKRSSHTKFRTNFVVHSSTIESHMQLKTVEIYKAVKAL